MLTIYIYIYDVPKKELPSSSSPGSGFVALGQRNSLVGVKIKETATSSARSAEGQLCVLYLKQERAWQCREGSVECGKQEVQLKQVYSVQSAISRALQCNI